MNSKPPLPLTPTTLLTLLHHPTPHKPFTQILALLLTSNLTSNLSVLTLIAPRLPAYTTPYTAYKTIHKSHHHPSPFLFNSLLSAYASTPTPKSSLTVYKLMLSDRIPFDKYSFPIILKSCAKFKGSAEARQLHCAAVKLGFVTDLFVQNALVSVYCTCQEWLDAGKVFDGMPVRDVVSWTGMISGLVKAGFFARAMRLFGLMDVDPNGATLVSVLVACGRLGDFATGSKIHALLVKNGLEAGIVAGNATLDMYVKCERLNEARRVFKQLPKRDIVSWTSIISGFVHCNNPKDAIKFFHAMQASGVEPDKMVLSSVLSACASLGALESGKWIHEYLERKGIEWDCHIGTALVDMYVKCGCLEKALHTFQMMPRKNVSSWNALLGGLAMHGHGKDALDHFDRMVTMGVAPNDVTFIAVLSACSHCGLLEEGRHHFYLMTKCYNITPMIVHYGCMVDLLCRAGLLTEAYELVRTMPMKADVHIWGTLLSACQTCTNADLSHQILSQVGQVLELEVEPSDSGVYVLLSNIFATTNRWSEVKRIRKLMREKGISKEPGFSVLELNGKAYEFLAGDNSFSNKEEILMMLGILAKQMQLDMQ